MTGGTVIFIIILLAGLSVMFISGITLLTPSTRAMLPPKYSISAIILTAATLAASGYMLLGDESAVAK